MRSDVSRTFMGSTALMSNLSCDSVTAGALFPQPDYRVPEEAISQHAYQHTVSPPGKLPHRVVNHPEIRFVLLNALLDRPPPLPIVEKQVTESGLFVKRLFYDVSLKGFIMMDKFMRSN